MADLAKIKRNVAKMAAQGAPIEDIDGYIASQGVTVDEVRAFKPQQATPAPSMGIGEDMARSGATGIRQGIEGTVGMFGDAAKMTGDIVGWGAGKLGASPETQDWARTIGRRVNPFGFAATTEEIQSATKPVIGENYKPQTVAGEYARTVGQFAPAAVAGPGSLGRKAAMTVVPALASETAGQATKGTAAEPYARGAAALIGGVAASGKNANVAKAPKMAAPTEQELAAQSSAFYRKAEQAGITIKPESFNRVVQNVELAAGRLNKDLRPNTAGIVDDVMALKGKPVTLQELDELRQVVGQSMKNAQPQDVRTLERIKGVLDNYADNAVTAADITGDIKGFEYIKEGRKLWAKKAKVATINEMVEKAKNQATGYENGLVIQFRQLANNKKRLRQFSPEEQKMIIDVARRGTAHGVLRAVGMLSPNSTFGGLMTGGVGVGAGLVPGALIAGAGLAAKAGAGALTRGKVDAVQRAVATGVVPKAGPQPINIDALVRTLLAAQSGQNSAIANTPVR